MAQDIRMKLSGLKWRAGSAGRLGVSGSALRLTAEGSIHFLLAAVLAGAVVFEGSAPFGVAMVGASGAGVCGACALLGACLGYMTQLGFSNGLRYTAAAILTFAAAFAFYDVKLLRRAWAMPLVAGLINAGAGFVYLSQGGWRARDVLLFAAEACLTVTATRCYRAVLIPLRSGKRGDPRARVRQVGLLMLVCTALIALVPLTLLGLLSVGRGLAAAAVLCAAWQGGCAAGALLGVTAGLSMDLSGQGAALYATVYGLSALCAGAFRGKARAWAATVYVGAGALALLWTWERGASPTVLYEALFGAAVFLLVPRTLLERLGSWLTPREVGVTADSRAQELARRQLEGAAGAFRSLYEAVSAAFRVPPNDGDLSRVFDRAAAQACVGCARRSTCWEREYVSTFNALNDATAAMTARGRGEPADFPRHFADKCLHFPAFLGAVNRELAAALYRRQYNSRIRDSRMAVARQYAQLSDLLGSAAAELSQELIPDQSAQRRVRQRLRGMNLEAEAMAYRDVRGLLRVELTGAGCPAVKEPRELKALSALLGVPLRAEGTGDTLTLFQQEPLMAVAGVAARKKDGETVSGDAGTYFKGPDGSLYVLLCDGMGSGVAANRESSLAVRLLEQFLQAGVETEHALVTLSSALALRGEEAGGFTTVDLLRVDLFTGEGAVYKLGAAPTYVKRGKDVRRITGAALPAGLAAERDRPDKTPLQLSQGDCVLLVSDGVTGAEDDLWLREKLAEFDGGSPKELARALVAQSPQGATDDRTALVVRIERRQ